MGRRGISAKFYPQDGHHCDSNLEKLQEAEQIGELRGEIKGRQDLVLRLLKKRVGDVSADVLAKVSILPVERLDNLHDAALDFAQVSDLTDWLDLK